MNERPFDKRDREPDESSLESPELEGLPGPPDFPAATREQVEQSWQAIVTHLETDTTEARAGVSEGTSDPARRPAAERGRWWDLSRWAPQPLFPDWRLARAGALIATGFVVAWFAAGQGWLPGTWLADRPPLAAGEGNDPPPPDRSWLMADDYSQRLEALLLGLAQSTDQDASAVTPIAREVGRELLSDNRFYRRVAERNDDRSLGDLLAQVEIVLLALATAPPGQEEEVVNSVREFIGESNLLPDLRSVRSSMPPIPKKTVSTSSS